MSFINTINVLLVFCAALDGASAAVIGTRPAAPSVVDHRLQDVSSTIHDILSKLKQSGHNIPVNAVEVVKRAPQGVDMSEEDLLQLINEVQNVEGQLSGFLPNGQSPSALPSQDQIFNEPELDAPILDDVVELQPEVSSLVPEALITPLADFPGPVEPEVTSAIVEPGALDEFGDEIAAAPLSSGSLSSECTTTITQTFTEFIFLGISSTLDTSFSESGTSSILENALPAESTVSVPLNNGEIDDELLEDGFPQDDNLVPFGDEEGPSATVEAIPDLWELAAPSVTAPPVPEDAAALLDANPSPGSPVQEPQEELPIPSQMTLRLPGGDSTEIVWRTIDLPPARNT